MSSFVNREGEHLNKKILDVSSIERDNLGEITRLYVKETRDDEPVTVEGTILNAEGLTDAIQAMIDFEMNTIPFTDEQKLYIDKNRLSIPLAVHNSLSLPTLGKRGSIITWEVLSGTGISITNNTAVITQQLTNQTVYLKATLTCGDSVNTKNFTVTILPREMYDSERVTYDKNNLIIPQSVTEGFTLPTKGVKGSTISWIGGTQVGISISNNVVTFERGEDDLAFTLCATFVYGDASTTKNYNVVIIGTGTPDD